MLRKLTSPKPNAQRGSGAKQSASKELASSSPAGQPVGSKRVDRDDHAPPSTSAATLASRSDDAKAAPATAELRLDLHALGLASSDAPPDAPTGDHSERRRTLARSPRVRKNLLDEASEATGASASTTASLPTKGGGLRGLRGSAAKPSRAPREAADAEGSTRGGTSRPTGPKHSGDNNDNGRDKADKVGDGKRVSSSTDADKTKQRVPDTAEAKTLDERDNDDDARSEAEGAQRDERGEATQPAKHSLSPLRRRQPPAVSADASPSRGDSTLLGGRRRLQLLREDLAPPAQPEVHVVGEITSGEGFGTGGGFACKYGVELGSAWHRIAGDQVGQTQVDYPAAAGADIVWGHPLDLHFATSSFHGWPTLLLQVWRVDTHMAMNVVGYGFVRLPFAAGEHELTASLWRPMGAAKDELAAALLGRTPELVSDAVVFSAAWADRCRLRTLATGKVRLRVGVLLRNFQSSNLQI
ncbi:hypothetical protein PybrP1_011490 [[Pythium] brassicae (nom. inval.)]|nr:hypothetical protein PybrP1_011490 [[Pythium] brassicae (nom. inval.)]